MHVMNSAGRRSGRFRRAASVANSADPQLRANLRHATHTIRDKRLRVVDELADWEQLRDAGAAIKADVRRRLPELLDAVRGDATAAGATVHWARDADEACRIVVRPDPGGRAPTSSSRSSRWRPRRSGSTRPLSADGISAYETDLAELIVQLAGDTPSHILVPAIHYNRSRDPGHLPRRDARRARRPDRRARPTLADAARTHLRRRFLSARVAVSGANFAIADSGTLVVVESRGQRPDVPDPAARR